VARFAAALLLLVALLAAAVASRPGSPPADFTFVNRGDANTLDPARMSWLTDLRLARMLYEPLVRNDVLHEDLPIMPGVAERWKISADGRAYTFFLNPEAAWSNGEPVTAHDFVYSWRRAMLPDTGSKYISFFQLVEGAQDFYDWRADALERMASENPPFENGAALWDQTLRAFDDMVSMEARGNHELWMRLERPVPYFLDVCAFGVLSPVYPPLIERYESPDDRTGRIEARSGWTKPGIHVGNGPFRMTAWRFKDEMRMEASPHYWNADALDIRTVAVKAIDDPNAAVLAFRSGVVDWVPDLTVGYRAEIYKDKLEYYDEHHADYERLKAMGLDAFTIDHRLPPDPRLDVHVTPVFGTYFYNFNCSPRLPDGRRNPFADARVRRAFALAIDKKAVTDEVRRLGEPVASSLVPPGSLAGYAPPRGLPDVGSAETEAQRQAIIDRALELLAEAGYENPAEDFPITVEILFNEDAGHDLIAQVVAKSWREHLGVPVSLAQKELKVFRNDLKDHNFIIGRAGWYGDYPDPMTFLEINRTGSGNNDRNFSSRAFDRLLAQAREEPDEDRRAALLLEAERLIVADELPLIPIFHYVDVAMFDPKRITGLSPNPRGQQDVDRVDVLGDGVGDDEWKPMRRGSAH